jgi:hypothetical protein
MPSASVSTATSAKPGLLAIPRNAYRTSCRNSLHIVALRRVLAWRRATTAHASRTEP